MSLVQLFAGKMRLSSAFEADLYSAATFHLIYVTK